MNPFSWIFEHLIFNPQLNLLYGLYQLTGDIGWSIVLLAMLVNLLLWPLFWGTYVNGQKIRVLQPQLKKLQTQYKDNPQELWRKTQEFYKQHGMNNGSFFLVIIAQFFFAIGLLNVTREVSSGEAVNGLYQPIWGQTQAIFDNPVALGSINIGTAASDFIWFAIANLLLSFAYGWYTFRIAPKPIIREEMEKRIKQQDAKEKEKKGDQPDTPPALDPEQMQKMIQFQTIWFFPWLMFFSNLAFTLGVNIYFVTVSLLSLSRQIAVTWYYSQNEGKLLESIIQSDPLFHDLDPSNNLENTADPAIMEDTEPVAAQIIDAEVVPVTQPAKKSSKKPAKKTSPKNSKSKKSSKATTRKKKKVSSGK